MSISEKKKARNNRYTKKCDSINIRPIKERGAKIRQTAANAGMSLQGYILQAVEEKMEREGND
jgi:predicted DNA binding CopG/RHH family protein